MINAFRQIRLTNKLLTVTGADNRLQIGDQTTVFQSETGGFVTNLQTGSFLTTSQSGQFYPNSNPSGFINSTQTGTFYPLSNPNSYISTGNGDTRYALTSATGSFVTTSQTGVYADAGKLALTGASFATYTGKQLSFSTSLTPTGLDVYAISFPVTFSSAPRVQSTIEVTGNIMYSINIQSRTTSGYNALISDFIGESGVVLHSFCSLN